VCHTKVVGIEKTFLTIPHMTAFRTILFCNLREITIGTISEEIYLKAKNKRTAKFQARKVFLGKLFLID